MRSTLTVLFLGCIASIANGQDSTAIAPAPAEHPYRDPHKARVLATILPGAGYAYTGEYFRGYGTWVITATGLVLTPILVSDDCSLITWTCNTEGRVMNLLYGALLTTSSVLTWVSSVRDAPKSAERANERHRRRELKVHPTLTVPQSHNGVNAGLSVAW